MAGVFQLYEQLLPTRLYACQKTHTDTTGEMMCRLCNEAPENVADVLAGCTALAQNKYVTRHNAALKILFFEVLPNQSPLKPKRVYEANNAQAFWYVPLFAEHKEVRANRLDARIINHESKRVHHAGDELPMVTNREKKEEEKTTKYGPLRRELKQKYQGYEVKQCNIIIDALGGWCRD